VKFLLVNKAQSPETLFEMATRGTKKITLIEMLEKVGKDIGKSTKWGMMQDLGRYHVETITNSRVIEIIPEGLKVEQLKDSHHLRPLLPHERLQDRIAFCFQSCRHICPCAGWLREIKIH